MDDYKITRLSRLTSILTQLQSKRIVTATYLAEKHQVSIRTIYRDIRALEDSGVPIVVEEGKGYTLMQGYQLPPVMFTEEEANALITAEKWINTTKDGSLIEHYNLAITKIKSILKHAQKTKADLLADRIVFRSSDQIETTSNYLITLQKAITTFSLVEMTYTSLQNQTTKRTIEAFALYSTQNNWILIAFCRLRREFRSFRIDLIENLHVLTSTFEPHQITLEDYFKMCRESQNKKNNPKMGL